MYKYSGTCSSVVTELRGQTVAITGKVHIFGEHVKRSVLEQDLQRHGARFKTDVTGQISLLVHGDLTGQPVTDKTLEFSQKLLGVLGQDVLEHHVCVVSSAGLESLLDGNHARCFTLSDGARLDADGKSDPG